MLYKQEESPQMVQGGVDGWVKQKHDFHPRGRGLYPTRNLEWTFPKANQVVM